MRTPVLVPALVLSLGLGASAQAQQVPFSQTVDAGAAPTVAIETTRGQVEVTGADVPRLEVAGTVVVRLGLNVPADALDLARAVAKAPPVTVTGSQVRLSLPADERARQAVIVHWRVRVPRAAAVDIRTASGEIRLSDVRGAARADTGSGAVSVIGATGGLTVASRSSAIDLARLAGDVRVRSGSGSVRIAMSGPGAIDAETRSSAIEIDGASASLQARSGSGAIEVGGRPTADWQIETRSSQIRIEATGAPAFRQD
ncbi:MAG TPA: DUF4097 family beta strand repeat-containing protein, partial [Luteitalea sp.]|nr:DUF4097 family beta strand repeat-containing protein [Luteitalea sp.]